MFLLENNKNTDILLIYLFITARSIRSSNLYDWNETRQWSLFLISHKLSVREILTQIAIRQMLHLWFSLYLSCNISQSL